MKFLSPLRRAALLAAALLGPSLTLAADYPAPKEADWTAKDFRFHTGEVVADLRIHYTTIGSPSGEPGGIAGEEGDVGAFAAECARDRLADAAAAAGDQGALAFELQIHASVQKRPTGLRQE